MLLSHVERVSERSDESCALRGVAKGVCEGCNTSHSSRTQQMSALLGIFEWLGIKSNSYSENFATLRRKIVDPLL
jgi:hypothetical protein